MEISVLRLGQIGTNCYIFRQADGKKCGIVDPGDQGEQVAKWLKDQGLEPEAVLLTHGHFDHILGIPGLRKTWPNLPVYCHPADFGEGETTGIFGERFPTVRAFGTITPYQEGDVVNVAGFDLEVLETPGHTPGSVCLRCGDVLFTGDTLFAGSMGRTDLPGGDEDTIMRSLRRLYELDGNYQVCPGHEGQSTLEQERKSNYCMRMAMRAEMKIWLTSDNVDWDAGRYRYPTEQMLLTLFPDERPEYPDTPVPTALNTEPNSVIFTLHRGKKLTNMSALLLRDSRWHNGVVRFPSEKLDEPPEQVYHTVSHALKQAFYKAGTALLGHDLPWGSLTGVRPVKLPTKAMLVGKTAKQAEKELQKEYHVSPPRAALAVECAQAALEVKRGLSLDSMALYIGIPFCPTRCAYCSFISADVKRSLALVEPYVDALCREIELAGELLRARGLHIGSAYMGGGTPTTLSAEQLDRVLSAVETHLPMESCAEFTVEAGRPDTITADKLETLKSHGIHRISINPQTMEDDVLCAMGRAHTAAQIEEAMELAGRHFGGMVNMDLIAGLPTDTVEGFERTLNRVLTMDPANITVHTLALKKGSRIREEGGALCTPEKVEAMLAVASERLRGAGYAPYYLYRQKYMSGSFENVGWTKPGAVCAYNIVMMEELQTVLSLGAGGITKLVDFEHSKITRLSNPKYAKEYLESWDKISADKETAAQFQADLAGR